MKTIYFLFTLCVTGFGLIACKESEPLMPEPPGKPPVESVDSASYRTPVGTPVGEATSKTIGPAGGFIATNDGKIRVTIPAGALAAAQEFSVQPVTNHNAGGKGVAYRLTPHGNIFTKPATLTISYTEEDLENTIPEALGIAYQDNQNVWKAVGGVQTDTTRKTVSIQTTHFSDWSFFEAITTEMATNVISPGEKAVIVVKTNLIPSKEDLLTALTQEGRETTLLAAPNLLDPKHIMRWENVREGTLNTSGNTAEYQAPGRIPDRNPVELIVRIKLSGKAVGLIINRLYVAPPGVSFQVNNNEWITVPGSKISADGRHLIVTPPGIDALNIQWTGAEFGTFPWSQMGVAFTYAHQVHQTYTHIFGMNANISKGFLTIEPADDPSGKSILVGSFDVKSAGCVDLRNPASPKYTTEKLQGVFRIK